MKSGRSPQILKISGHVLGNEIQIIKVKLQHLVHVELLTVNGDYIRQQRGCGSDVVLSFATGIVNGKRRISAFGLAGVASDAAVRQYDFWQTVCIQI